MRPILFAVAIFTFTFNWGYFFGPLIYINSEEKMPLALGVQILSEKSRSKCVSQQSRQKRKYH